MDSEYYKVKIRWYDTTTGKPVDWRDLHFIGSWGQVPTVNESRRPTDEPLIASDVADYLRSWFEK